MEEYEQMLPVVNDNRVNIIIYYVQFGLTFVMFCMMIAMTSYMSTTRNDSRKLLTDG